MNTQFPSDTDGPASLAAIEALGARLAEARTGIGVGRGRSVGGHQALLLLMGIITREAQN